jgi:hypothetical protein
LRCSFAGDVLVFLSCVQKQGKRKKGKKISQKEEQGRRQKIAKKKREKKPPKKKQEKSKNENKIKRRPPNVFQKIVRGKSQNQENSANNKQKASDT